MADATQTAPLPADAARIGPNAVIQLLKSLRALTGEAATREVFARADGRSFLDRTPKAMVAETDVARLYEALFACLPRAEAEAVAADAGRRTADYVIARRIPRPVRAVLKALPAPLAAPLLLKAIERNAWTFAGSGRVRVTPGVPAVVEIESNPLSMPGCAWHTAVFRRLFEVLVAPRVEVAHEQYDEGGSDVCRFEIRTGTGPRAQEER